MAMGNSGTFTTPILVTDTTHVAGGSTDSIVNTPTPGVALDVQSTSGAFKVPQMTTLQRLALPITSAQNGSLIYDTTLNQLMSVQSGASTPLVGGGDPNAKYIIQQADASLPNAQSLGTLPDGVLTNTVTGSTGVLSAVTRIIDDETNGNFGFGFSAYNNTATGTGNLFIGYQCGQSVTDATSAIGIGYQALQSLTGSSDGSIAIGTFALSSYAGGADGNIAIGVASLASLSANDEKNTALGGAAGTALNGAFHNVCVGFGALGSALLSHGTVAVGYLAGSAQNNSTDCVFIGSGATAGVDALTNAIAIGNNATIGASDSCVIGDGTVKVGIGTNTPGTFLNVVSGADPGILVTSSVMALSAHGGVSYTVTPTATDYTALASDYFILVTSTAASRTITLPAVTAANTGQIYTIKDGDGGSATHAIVIQPTGAQIDGAGSLSISATGKPAASVINDGTNWWSFARG